MTTKTALPDQPDGIEDDSYDLPALDRAAERVGEYIRANGDGMYHEIDGNPLYARDLEALRRAAEEAIGLRTARDLLAAEVRKVRAQMDDARYSIDQVLAKRDEALAELDKVRAQLADTQKRAHTDATNLQQILRDKTALANERDAMREVVEAAKVWREWYGNTNPSYASACNDLAAAVNALTESEVAR